MRLEIPTQHFGGIADLVKASPDEIEVLFQSLGSARPAFKLEDLARQVARDSVFPVETVEGILRALAGLYILLGRPGVTAQSLANDLVDALKRAGKEDLYPGEAEEEATKQRFARALSFEKSVGLTAKAQDVMREHAHWFCASRILTDVRPVFYSDPNQSPAAVVMVHTLKIRYHAGEAGEPAREFYVALDHDDVDDLLNTLQRAKEKEKSAKNLLAGRDVLVLESD